mmetsp:Transcript_17201/g.31705  ORF Transcript_17201/g.31705 Transcript_17201/m.31705 type:complete len:615 (+) Transcript_17201:3-1847(+)
MAGAQTGESCASFSANYYRKHESSAANGPMDSLKKLSHNIQRTMSGALTGQRSRGTSRGGNGSVLSGQSSSSRQQLGNFATTPIVPHEALSACVETEGDEWASLRSLGVGINGPPMPGKTARTEPTRSFFERVVTSPVFDFCTGWLIALNAIMIGIQTDTMARNGTDDMPQALWVGELIFLICFTLELALRLAAFGYRLFILPGWTWAIFDCIVVGMQIVEFFIDALTSDEGGGNMGFMRLMRILRLVRVLRVVRIIRFLSELRTIVISILGSMRSLMWTLVLLLLGIYIVGIYFTQLVSDHVITLGQDSTLTESEKMMLTYYSNLSRSMLSLFQAMSGGLDWDVVCQPLIDNISWLQGIIFSLYISATVLALMNVVTGVFVEEALKSAKKEDTEYMSGYLMQMFQEADADGTGMLGVEKFMRMCTEADFINYIRSIEVDPDEAMALFHLLDLDGSNSIEYEEFVRGCLRLRGSAKAIDVLSLLHGVKAISNNLNDYMEDMGACLEEVISRLEEKDCADDRDHDPHKPDGVKGLRRFSETQGRIRSSSCVSFDALDVRLKLKMQGQMAPTPGSPTSQSQSRASVKPSIFAQPIDLRGIEGLGRTDAWDVAVKDV